MEMNKSCLTRNAIRDMARSVTSRWSRLAWIRLFFRQSYCLEYDGERIDDADDEKLAAFFAILEQNVVEELTSLGLTLEAIAPADKKNQRDRDLASSFQRAYHPTRDRTNFKEETWEIERLPELPLRRPNTRTLALLALALHASGVFEATPLLFFLRYDYLTEFLLVARSLISANRDDADVMAWIADLLKHARYALVDCVVDSIPSLLDELMDLDTRDRTMEAMVSGGDAYLTRRYYEQFADWHRYFSGQRSGHKQDPPPLDIDVDYLTSVLNARFSCAASHYVMEKIFKAISEVHQGRSAGQSSQMTLDIVRNRRYSFGERLEFALKDIRERSHAV